MKFAFPFLWIGGFTLGTIAMFFAGQEAGVGSGSTTVKPTSQPPPPEMKWVFLAITLAGSAFLYWACMRLKRVAIDGTTLLISNYFTTIAVSLAEVADVRENRWLNIHPVTILFRRPTDFGSSVMFMPKVRWFGLFSSHPVVDEIRTAAGLTTR